MTNTIYATSAETCLRDVIARQPCSIEDAKRGLAEISACRAENEVLYSRIARLADGALRDNGVFQQRITELERDNARLVDEIKRLCMALIEVKEMSEAKG